MARAIAELRCEGGGAEAVHARRVASRRLRAAVALLAPWSRPGLAHRAQVRLKAVTQRWREAREWEVAKDLLHQLRTNATAELERAALESLMIRAEREAHRARKGSTKASSRALAREAVKAMKRWREACAGRCVAGTLPDAARAYVVPRLRDGLDPLPRLALQEDAEAMHAARLAVKALRYGLEVLAQLSVKGLEPALESLRDLQAALGSHHDWVVLDAWMEERRRALQKKGCVALAEGVAQAQRRCQEGRAEAYRHVQRTVSEAQIETLRAQLGAL